MLLATFLNDSGMTASDFADRIEVSAEAVRLYLAGKRIPNKNVMPRIIATTNGKVRPNDFYETAAE